MSDHNRSVSLLLISFYRVYIYVAAKHLTVSSAAVYYGGHGFFMRQFCQTVAAYVHAGGRLPTGF